MDIIVKTRKPINRSTYPTNTLQVVNQWFQAQSAVSYCEDHAALTVGGRRGGGAEGADTLPTRCRPCPILRDCAPSYSAKQGVIRHKKPSLHSLVYLFSVTVVLCIPNHAVQAQEGGESLEEKNKHKTVLE